MGVIQADYFLEMKEVKFLTPVMQFYTGRKLHMRFFFHIRVMKANIKSECYTEDWVEAFSSSSRKIY